MLREYAGEGENFKNRYFAKTDKHPSPPAQQTIKKKQCERAREAETH